MKGYSLVLHPSDIADNTTVFKLTGSKPYRFMKNGIKLYTEDGVEVVVDRPVLNGGGHINTAHEDTALRIDFDTLRALSDYVQEVLDEKYEHK